MRGHVRAAGGGGYTGLEMTLEDFTPTADDVTTPVTSANLPEAVLAGCTHRLFGMRRAACEALRRGFLRCEDLQLQLAALGSPEALTLLLRGRESLSTEELLQCFALPNESESESEAAGFAVVGSEVPAHFEALLRDEAAFDQEQRLRLFRWCTALSAVPTGGLQDHKIRLRLYGAEEDDATLPETHTCTREIFIPNYTSSHVLREKLMRALEHADDGFQKQ